MVLSIAEKSGGHAKRASALSISLGARDRLAAGAQRGLDERILTTSQSLVVTVIDIMRTHAMIVIGGILQQNPFFMPPEQFLRERRSRQP